MTTAYSGRAAKAPRHISQSPDDIPVTEGKQEFPSGERSLLPPEPSRARRASRPLERERAEDRVDRRVDHLGWPGPADRDVGVL